MTNTLNPTRYEELILAWVNVGGPEEALDFPRFRNEVEALCTRFPEVFKELREYRGGEASSDDDFLAACWGIQRHLRAAWMASDSDDRSWYIFRLRQLFHLHRKELAAPALRRGATRIARKLSRAIAARDKELIRKGESFGEFEERLSSDPALQEKYFAPLRFEEASDEPFLPESVEDAFGRAGESLFAKAEFWGYHVQPRPPLTAVESVMRHFAEVAYRTRRCANPKCPTPFFLMNKRRQQFCSPSCAALARQEAKRRWWEKHKSTQLEKRKAERRRQKQQAHPRRGK